MEQSRRGVLAALLGLSLGLGGSAPADPNIDLSRYLAQHGYCYAEVDNSEANRAYVEAKVNGKELRFFIDTGWGRTTLTAGSARRLGLDVHDTSEPDEALGGTVHGNMGIALINRFQLNDFDINRTNTIRVLPKENGWREADGALGFDFLHLNAALLPVGGSVIFFRPGTLAVPDIGPYMDALGFKSIPLHYERGALRVEGDLDGHALDAIVDCGATFTAFDLDYVRAAGQRPQSLGMKEIGVDGRSIETYGFSPRQMVLGPLHLPPIEVSAIASPGFSKWGANALVGCDILGTNHAIVDLGHDVLWMR